MTELSGALSPRTFIVLLLLFLPQLWCVIYATLFAAFAGAIVSFGLIIAALVADLSRNQFPRSIKFIIQSMAAAFLLFAFPANARRNKLKKPQHRLLRSIALWISTSLASIFVITAEVFAAIRSEPKRRSSSAATSTRLSAPLRQMKTIETKGDEMKRA